MTVCFSFFIFFHSQKVLNKLKKQGLPVLPVLQFKMKHTQQQILHSTVLKVQEVAS